MDAHHFTGTFASVYRLKFLGRGQLAPIRLIPFSFYGRGALWPSPVSLLFVDLVGFPDKPFLPAAGCGCSVKRCHGCVVSADVRGSSSSRCNRSHQNTPKCSSRMTRVYLVPGRLRVPTMRSQKVGNWDISGFSPCSQSACKRSASQRRRPSVASSSLSKN